MRPFGLPFLAVACALLASAAPHHALGRSLEPALERTVLGLLRLSEHPDGPRLIGEDDRREWMLQVPAETAAAGGDFRISYLASASVLPDGSHLSLFVNGRALGTAPIGSPTSIRFATFTVPPGLLSAGRNVIRIGAVQRHRVDCGLDATAELWTQIDLSSTGLVPVAGAGTGRGFEFSALNERGEFPIRVTLSEVPAKESEVARALIATQAIALISGATRPVVTFGEQDEARFGVGVVFGSAAPTTTSQIAFSGDSALQDAAIRKLVARANASFSSKGIVAEGAERIQLGEHGVSDAGASHRARRFSFGLFLPKDALLSEHAKIEVDVAMSGAASHAVVNVGANGASVASATVALSGTENVTHARLLFSADHLRPGENRLSLQVAPTRPAISACPIKEDANVKVLAASAITLPILARIDRSPELALFAAGAVGTQRLKLHVPTPDSLSLGAAATLLARLALAGRQTIEADFSASREVNEGPALVVGIAPGFSRSTLTTSGVDPDALRIAWQDRGQIAKPQLGQRRLLREDRMAGCTAGSLRTKAGEGATLHNAHLVVAQGGTGGPGRMITVVTSHDGRTLADAINCLVDPRVWPLLSGATALIDASTGIVHATPAAHYVYASPFTYGLSNARQVFASWLTLNPGAFVIVCGVLALALAAASSWFVAHVGRKA